MHLELLHFEGCPHVADSQARLRGVLDRLAPGTAVNPVLVATQADAEARGFHGSPSIRIDGRDLEGLEHEPSSYGCRLYEGHGVPPVWLLEAGVLRALGPRHVLFLCVANSARSQMAEGIARALAPAGVTVSSAGSHPTSVRPEAVAALREIDIDISSHHSEAVADVDAAGVDAVITLCADEVCPAFLGRAHRLHWGLPDPAGVEGDEARASAFRDVRDELRRRLGALLA